MTLHILIDIAQLISGFLAAITLLIYFFSNRRNSGPPFKRLYCSIYNQENNTANYYIVLKNIHDQPVTLLNVTIYANKKYTILKEKGFRSKLSESFSSEDQVANKSISEKIDHGGLFKGTICGTKLKEQIKPFYLYLDTSHGTHVIRVKKFNVNSSGEEPSYENPLVFRHKREAKVEYYKTMLKQLFMGY